MKDLTPLWFLCSSYLIPPLAFVALLEFESEGLEHFVCSCHCILHRFEPSTRIRVGITCELVTLGSLDPRRLLWPRPFVVT